jgi:hypothetical protein
MKYTQSLDLMDYDEEMRLMELRYPKIAFRHGDKPKSFFFNIVYTLIWLVLVLAVSGAGYLFVSPYCGLGAILSLLMLKGLLDVLMGNTVLVAVGKQTMAHNQGMYEDQGSLVFRKTKEKTKKDYELQKKFAKKFMAMDEAEVEQKLDSTISDILSDYEENNQGRAFAIASLLYMDKNKDGKVSEAEMLDTTFDGILDSFDLEADQTAIKASEALANQILPYLDSNPNATSKDIVEKFSNIQSDDKYDPFA